MEHLRTLENILKYVYEIILIEYRRGQDDTDDLYC